MAYRCVATSVEGFIQQLAVSYVSRGYVYFVQGRVPEGKDPELVDQKLMATYGVDVSKFVRARRKQQGKANVHYLRFGRSWVLLASHGVHERFFRMEAGNLRDARETPIRFMGYAGSYRGGHASVRIDHEGYLELKAHLLDLAARRKGEVVEAEFRGIGLVLYAPVRRQLLSIFRAVNELRRVAGFQLLSKWCVRLERRKVKVFEGEAGSSSYPRHRPDSPESLAEHGAEKPHSTTAGALSRLQKGR